MMKAFTYTVNFADEAARPMSVSVKYHAPSPELEEVYEIVIEAAYGVAARMGLETEGFDATSIECVDTGEKMEF